MTNKLKFNNTFFNRSLFLLFKLYVKHLFLKCKFILFYSSVFHMKQVMRNTLCSKIYYWLVSGSPIGSLLGGFMFKNIGSINYFKLLSIMSIITCITQVFVNHLISRFSRNKDVKDNVYSIVETTDNIEDTTMPL